MPEPSCPLPTSAYNLELLHQEGGSGEQSGGTMQPIQVTPRFSPFYIESEEYLGGYNFGTGNCQLDFLNMKLDWACG